MAFLYFSAGGMNGPALDIYFVSGCPFGEGEYYLYGCLGGESSSLNFGG
jgi:hypothetical protein